jgi:hypothetical protein
MAELRRYIKWEEYSKNKAGRTLWHHQYQFVSLENLERAKEKSCHWQLFRFDLILGWSSFAQETLDESLLALIGLAYVGEPFPTDLNP